MSQQALDAAAEFCALVHTADLFEYLGLARETSSEDAIEALSKKRRYMQGMQSNPKFKDSARFLIKNYRLLEEVLRNPGAHFEAARRAREEERLPMLLLAIEGVLADGLVSVEEEQFLRTSAEKLGISIERYEAVLQERADALDAHIETQGSSTAKLEGATAIKTEESRETTTQQPKGAEGKGWWDGAFTRLMLEVIPGGPGEMVDVYCRTALSAMTLLPERTQLDWIGVDRSADRIEESRRQLAQPEMASIAKRSRLIHGAPDQLPLEDESVDYVLAVRALGNLHDTRPVLKEAYRVLRPGGRVIIAEPDGIGENFIFDEHLQGYNRAFHELVIGVDALLGGPGSPLHRGGLALGPALPGRLLRAGFHDIEVRIHGSNNLGVRSFKNFAKRMRRYPTAMARAAGWSANHPLLTSVLREVDLLEVRLDPDAATICGTALPMYLAFGIKE